MGDEKDPLLLWISQTLLEEFVFQRKLEFFGVGIVEPTFKVFYT